MKFNIVTATILYFNTKHNKSAADSTCSERCSQTDRTCRSSRPRYKYAAAITLASGAIPHHL